MEKEKLDDFCRRLVSAASMGARILIILRGLPGRGKTTTALAIQSFCRGNRIDAECSAGDDYMVDALGNYAFNVFNLENCHSSCIARLCECMETGTSVVVQHNTNTLIWESEYLRGIAEEMGYSVIMYEPDHCWTLQSKLPQELQNILMNTHGVDEQIMKKMQNRKQDIDPCYCAHWLHRSQFKECVERAYNEVYSKVCQEFSSRFGALEKDYSPMLHLTTDFIKSKLDGEELPNRCFDRNVFDQRCLSTTELNVIAIFADCRGIGALVSHPSDHRKIDAFNDFTTVFTEDDRDVPHITLHIAKGSYGFQVGLAAKEFKKFIDENAEAFMPENRTPHEISHNSMIGYLFPNPVPLHAYYAGAYGPKPNKVSHYFWNHSSQESRKIFQTLILRKDVHVTIESVPYEILPGGWKFADVRISPSQGLSDDQSYAYNEFLRKHLPRGLSYLVSPDLKAMKVITGLPKFTSQEEDIEEVTGDLNATDEMEMDVQKFFSRPMHTASSPHILVTEKANGEAGHITFIEVDGVVLLVGGSKNVHMCVRLTNVLEDLEYYKGGRYSYAKDILRCFYSTLLDIKDCKQKYLIDVMIANKWVAIFEYEDPSHAHVITVKYRRLKFITFTSTCDTVRSSTSLCCTSPLENMQLMESLGFETVWHFNSKSDNKSLHELKQAILAENRFRIEGCVLYFMDGPEVIGLTKCKNAYYVCCRALREKVIHSIKSLNTIMNSFSVSSIQNTLADIFSCQTMTMPADSNECKSVRVGILEKSFNGRLGSLDKSIVTEVIAAEEKLRKRFDDLIATQVCLTEECKEVWMGLGVGLFQYYGEEYRKAIHEVIDGVSFTEMDVRVQEIYMQEAAIAAAALDVHTVGEVMNEQADTAVVVMAVNTGMMISTTQTHGEGGLVAMDIAIGVDSTNNTSEPKVGAMTEGRGQSDERSNKKKAKRVRVPINKNIARLAYTTASDIWSRLEAATDGISPIGVRNNWPIIWGNFVEERLGSGVDGAMSSSSLIQLQELGDIPQSEL